MSERQEGQSVASRVARLGPRSDEEGRPRHALRAAPQLRRFVAAHQLPHPEVLPRSGSLEGRRRGCNPPAGGGHLTPNEPPHFSHILKLLLISARLRRFSRSAAETFARRISRCAGSSGFSGAEPVAPLIVDALKRLEYRGYDSAGIATLEDGQLARRRAERQARQPRGAAERRAARRHTPASATRAGRRTARRPNRTRIRTRPSASPSSTTASSRISRR